MKKHNPRARGRELAPLAFRISSMKVDQVIRLPRKNAPGKSWLCKQGRDCGLVLTIQPIDAWIVILRLA